jgi:uncharacterized protein (TIGR02300 family)
VAEAARRGARNGALLLTVALRHGKGAALHPTPHSKTPRNAALANPELGAKQICPTCSTKFYDLARRPAACPKCGAEFDPEEALRNRRVRARSFASEVEPDETPPPEAADAGDGFEAEPEEAPELDAVVDEAPLLADDEAEEADATPGAPGEALGVDFAEEDEIESSDDDGVPFIEDEDDEFSDDEIDGLPAEGREEDR